jgi:soluble lytic murein transglycosylase
MSRKQFLPPDDLKPVYNPRMSDQEMGVVNESLKKFMVEHDSDRDVRWAKYSQALLSQKTNPAFACALFTELQDKERFPLAQLSKIRKYRVCNLTPEESLKALQEIRQVREPWIKDVAFEIGLYLSEKSKNGREQIYFLEERSKEAIVPSEKTQPMIKAIEIAKAFGDQTGMERLQRRLYNLAPRFTPNPPKKDYLRIAHDFRRAREFESARSLFMQVFLDKKEDNDDRINALKGIRQSYKQESKKDEFIRVTRDLTDFTRAFTKKKKAPLATFKAHLDSQLTLVRTLWTAGQTDESLQLLKQIVAKPKKGVNLSEPYWLMARISEEGGDYKQAMKINETALAAEREGTNLWEKLIWQKAWNQRKLKDFPAAIESYKKLIAGAKNSDNGIKYQFWLGKTLKAANLDAEAEAVFEKIVEDDVLGFYGLIAHRELGKKLPPLIAAQAKALEKPDFMNEDEFSIARWLYSVGEVEPLREYLRMALMKNPIYKLKEEDQDRMMNWLAQTGDYSNLFLSVTYIKDKKRILDENPELMFPRPWESEITEAAAMSGVAPELLYAIMRQESAFNQYARSPVDAFGLLQLTLPTAEKTAKEKGVQFASHEDLYQPKLNIPLGASYMKTLLKKFENQMIMSIASYNASEDAVVSWLRNRYHGDPLEFIEDIPYSETMNYIKLVLRNFIFYSRLNSKGDSIAFPEWCLDGLQTLKTSSTTVPVSQ